MIAVNIGNKHLSLSFPPPYRQAYKDNHHDCSDSNSNDCSNGQGCSYGD